MHDKVKFSANLTLLPSTRDFAKMQSRLVKMLKFPKLIDSKRCNGECKHAGEIYRHIKEYPGDKHMDAHRSVLKVSSKSAANTYHGSIEIKDNRKE